MAKSRAKAKPQKKGGSGWIGALLGGIGGLLAIIAFITGKTSLPELMKEWNHQAVAESSAPATASLLASSPSTPAPKAGQPCQKLAEAGFNCSGDSLLQALAADNRPAIALFVEAGVDGAAPVAGASDKQVLDRAVELKSPGLGFLLAETYRAGRLEPCDALNKALSLDLADADRCALRSGNSCAPEVLKKLKGDASNEAADLDAAYAAMSSADACPAYYQKGAPASLASRGLPDPDCPAYSQEDMSNCLSVNFASGQAATLCQAASEKRVAGCLAKFCGGFTAEFRGAYPTKDAFRADIGPASRKLATLQRLETSCH
ncbi:MAG TPA: hypothetical protein VG942_19315 [Hyphomonadaceae bacterium]|nr:hypothetical protein [Hyphomonadaceae bacterium]